MLDVLDLLHPSCLVSVLKQFCYTYVQVSRDLLQIWRSLCPMCGVGESMVITRGEVASVVSVASRGEIASSCPRATLPSCRL